MFDFVAKRKSKREPRDRYIALFIAITLVWTIAWVWNASSDITLLLQQKIVTINIANDGSAKFIFSNAQPHHEIVYEMKSHWYPLLESNTTYFIGKTVKKPFEEYVRIKSIHLLSHFSITVLLPLAIFGVFLKYTPKIGFDKIKKN